MTSRLVAGSPQALAWGERMRKKRLAVRSAGLRTEKKFFGKRGVFARSGHTAHLKVNPRPEPYFTSWQMLIDYLKQEGWKPLGKKGVAAFGRTVRSLEQTLQLEARTWRILYRFSRGQAPMVTTSLGTYKTLDRALIAANRQANDVLYKITRKNPITIAGNPPKRRKGLKVFYAGVFIDGKREQSDGFRTAKEARAWIQGLKDEGFNVQVPGVYSETIQRPTSSRQTLRTRRNPPKQIKSTVAGVMYNKVLEIQAEKTGEKHKGFWYHPFKKGSDVQMLALDNGDVLIHSKAGKKLWRPD